MTTDPSPSRFMHAVERVSGEHPRNLLPEDRPQRHPLAADAMQALLEGGQKPAKPASPGAFRKTKTLDYRGLSV